VSQNLVSPVAEIRGLGLGGGRDGDGELFGGELGAWRRRRVGVLCAGRVGADGSGAQRAAVGHRLILAGAEFFFTATVVRSGPGQGARVSCAREAVNFRLLIGVHKPWVGNPTPGLCA
jgi:hypothetical protein